MSSLDSLPTEQPGKTPLITGKKRKHSSSARCNHNWTKKSIFFELSYWSKLKLRHNLDVMHIEKNVCDNIVGTLLGIEGKSKDTDEARMDLHDLKIREELWLIKRESRAPLKPRALHTFSKEEKKGFLDFLRSIKLPDGYASNIKRCVTDDGRLYGLKTHDCHVLIQKLLPVGILPYLNDNIRETLIEFCNFFKKICSRTLLKSEIKELKEGIVIVLCKLEKIFPPAFLTIMVHLCIHLPEQALLGGPVSTRWMFGYIKIICEKQCTTRKVDCSSLCC